MQTDAKPMQTDPIKPMQSKESHNDTNNDSNNQCVPINQTNKQYSVNRLVTVRSSKSEW
jgi:hypothetical protein